MFTDPLSPIGDNLMAPFVSLGKYLRASGHSFNTIDVEQNIFKFDAVIFIEFPTLKNIYYRKLVKNNYKNLYLIILEPEIINKENWKIENHKYFKKIFTFHDDFIDNKKYYKINYCFKKPENLNFDISVKKKLCAMIVGNKYKKYPGELYTERLKAIRWFEENHPEDFDLYGFGWNKYLFTNKYYFLNEVKIFKRLFKPNFPSYKGTIKSKNETLKKYKFSICYENVKDISGYITEKIFDCFFAGCVPVYLGAPNIKKYIPKNTFINKNLFKNYSELYDYMSNLELSDYKKYLENIKYFVTSEKFNSFSIDYFIQNIIGEIKI